MGADWPVEHLLGMLAVGDTIETILEGYPWLEREDVQACLVYARRRVGCERIERVQVSFVTCANEAASRFSGTPRPGGTDKARRHAMPRHG